MNNNHIYRNPIQLFLWWVSGAEVSILYKDECRTDHQKFSAIGATILMTTIVAFFAGTSAAWFFSVNGENQNGNLVLSLLFGILWAYIIFTIDRVLVITLKKDPKKKRFSYLTPFLFRVFLACIIAFMISIPLELFIFKDYITEERDNQFEQKNSEKYKILYSELGIDKIDSIISQLKENRTQLQNSLDIAMSRHSGEDNICAKYNHPESSKYKDAISEMDKIKIELKAPSITEGNRNQLEKELAKQKTIESEEIKSNNYKIIELIKGDNVVINNIYESIKKNDSLMIIYPKKHEELIKELNFRLDSFAIEYRNRNHFIKNFEILERIGRESKHEIIGILLWFIRGLFILIEILPTLVRIIMPVGVYDYKIQDIEDDKIKSIKTNLTN